MTVTSHTEERGAHAFMATSRIDRKRVFRAARRHSRFVRLVRVAIPLCAVLAMIALILVATVLDPLRALARLPVNLGGLVVSGTKITMVQPRFAGFTHDARPYVVTAQQAAQDITKPDRIELDQIRATMGSTDRETVPADSGTLELLAHSGVFETKADKLTLLRQIVISSSAYQARLSEAVINVRSGHVVSEKPVEVTMLQGTLNANRLEILNSGEVIRFEQGVTMVLEHVGTDGEARSR